jgi:hypothetical protein
MKYEFQTAFDYIKRGGLLISDDVHKNTAFPEFVNEKKTTAIQLLAKGGVTVKE